MKQYSVLEQREQTNRDRLYDKCFSAKDNFMGGNFKSKRFLVSALDQSRIKIHKNIWFDETRLELQHLLDAKMRLLPLQRTGWSGYFDVESTADFAKIIHDEMGISKKNATKMKEELFEEFDQMTNRRNAEPLSTDEKEQLILAVMKTAKELSKKTLEIE